jgi:hypothetical protein
MIVKRNSRPVSEAVAGPIHGPARPAPLREGRQPIGEKMREFAVEHPVWVITAGLFSGVLLGWLIKRR